MYRVRLDREGDQEERPEREPRERPKIKRDRDQRE